MPINTAKSPRRPLRLATIDGALAEADRIAALARAGTIQYSGNWDAGQILNHLAAWAEFVYTPMPLRVPWFIRLVVRPMKNRILRKGLPAGRRIPRVKAGTLATEHVSLDPALARFQKAFHRLTTDPPTMPSPLFGKLTQHEAIQLNLRHAELHMSFVKSWSAYQSPQ
jgi:hypothetical protein